jgi:hypothetical protein
MLRAAWLAVLALAAFGPAAVGVVSAQGGKAEPIRIEFPRGLDHATVRGRLRGDLQREYAFGARKGQRLAIRVRAQPARSLKIRVRHAGADLPAVIDSSQQLSMALPEDGEYELWVTRVAPTPGRSDYALTVTIR